MTDLTVHDSPQEIREAVRAAVDALSDAARAEKHFGRRRREHIACLLRLHNAALAAERDDEPDPEAPNAGSTPQLDIQHEPGPCCTRASITWHTPGGRLDAQVPGDLAQPLVDALLADAAGDRPELLKLLGELAGIAGVDQPCRMDHHGHCQAHGWLDHRTTCPVGRAAVLLAKEGGDG